MRFVIALLLLAATATSAWSQDSDQLRLLANAFGTYYSKVEAPEEVLKQLDAAGTHPEATAFIKECIRKKGKVLQPIYLQRPTEKVLRDLWLVRQLDLESNTGREPRHPLRVLDSLNTVQPDYYNLVLDYYLMLFGKATNQYSLKKFRKMNFNLNELGLDQMEQEIFFLSCMYYLRRRHFLDYDYLPSEIIPWKEIYQRTQYLPKFNGLPYFTFTGFIGEDRLVQIFSDVPYPTSFYHTFLDAYYDLLVKHILSIYINNESKQEFFDLRTYSWLNAPTYFKYSRNQPFLYRISRGDHNP